MRFTWPAVTGVQSIRYLALQSGRGTAEGLFVLFLLAAATTVLAYRGIGGQLVRLANLVFVLRFVLGLVAALL